MACNKCGSSALTNHVVWREGGHQPGYLRCSDCGNVQPTEETAAALRIERREERAEAVVEAAAAEVTVDAIALLDGTVPELTARLADTDDVTLLESALQAEAAGRNRMGATAAIQARIDALAAEAAEANG